MIATGGRKMEIVRRPTGRVNTIEKEARELGRDPPIHLHLNKAEATQVSSQAGSLIESKSLMVQKSKSRVADKFSS